MIKILFFASFREELETQAEQIELGALSNVGSLLDCLRERGDPWSKVFDEGRTLIMAVNQEMADVNTKIQDGDEIAFFPPVTGG